MTGAARALAVLIAIAQNEHDGGPATDRCHEIAETRDDDRRNGCGDDDRAERDYERWLDRGWQ